MEVSLAAALPFVLPINNASAKLAPADTLEFQPELAPVKSADASQTPAAVVMLGRTIEPPAVYTEPVVVNYLRDKSHTSPAASAASQALLQSFNQLADKKNTFSVSNLFNKLGALSSETNEYRNEVRKFYVPQHTTVEKFNPNFLGSVGARAESVFLTIKTRDGDNVSIQFSRNMAGRETSQMQFSFVVDGELSEKEQQALAALTEKLGAMGDEFFRTDTTELRGLKDIDTDVIDYFNFTLQRYDPVKDTYVEHQYEFSVDEIAQTQTLRASDVKGYSVDITMQLQGLIEGKNVERDVLQQYIDLINRAGDESDSPNASKRFMLDAFESMFSGLLTVVNNNGEEKADRAESSIAAFDSGLPDFNATFRSPVFHNPDYYSQVESMVLTLEQKTRVEENGDNLLIKQHSNYKFTNSYFENFNISSRDDFENLGGNYTYITEQEAGSVSRLLSMTNDVVNNIWIEQDVSREVRKTRFENYKVVDDSSISFADRRVQEFAELLQKYNGNKQHSAVEDLLKSSKDTLFLSI